jgi:EmrB/QacA subfamily drug resistance transporter
MPQLGILAVLAAAEFMLTLDLSIVNVALPSIGRHLAFGHSSLQWVVNGYALTFGGFLLLGGRATDLWGGRRVFLGALIVFSLASLACGLATGQVELVVARAVQGLSAGVLSPATLSILTSTFRRPGERTRALSIWTAVAIGGGAVGALVGGVLTGALSWRWIFFVNVPVGALLVVLAISRLPRTAADTARRSLDVAGAITVTAGLTALVWALITSGTAGWGSSRVIGALAAAAVLLSAFAVLEMRLVRAPLVPFSVFRSRPLSAGNLLSFLSFVPVTATWFFLSLYLQGVRSYTPIQAGLIFLPISLAVIGGSQAGFKLISRVDGRLLIGVGGLVAAAGMAWLGQLSTDTAIAWVMAPACATMVGGGLMFAPVTVAATAGVAPEQGGLASGLLNTTRQVGGALGLAILGTIAAARTAGHVGESRAAALTAGYASAYLIGSGVFLATAIVGVVALPARLIPSEASDDTAHGRPAAARARPAAKLRGAPR